MLGWDITTHPNFLTIIIWCLTLDLNTSFSFDFNSSLTTPIQQELKNKYSEFLNRLDKGQIYLKNLKVLCPGILDEKSTPPTVEDVDLLNANLGTILVSLNEGGLNFGNIGTLSFGLSLSGYEMNPLTGEIISLPIETVNVLISWIENSIEKSTNKQYLNCVLALSRLMNCIDKELIEKMLILIDSLTSLNITPFVTTETIISDLKKISLSLNEDPNISQFDNNITDLFVQKHLVTTKLYSMIIKKIMFIGGYDPDILMQFNI